MNEAPTSTLLMYFVYGLAFFSLGVAAFTQRHIDKGRFPFLDSVRSLGAFGLLHGVYEWLVLARLLNFIPSSSLASKAVGSLLVGLSYAFLWHFGLRLMPTPRRHRVLLWIPFIVLVLLILGWFLVALFGNPQYRHFGISTRYALALPGGLTTAIALTMHAMVFKRMRLNRLVPAFYGMSVVIGMYAILSGLVVPEASFPPANFINTASFASTFGFPVQLLRTACAVAITGFFLQANTIFDFENRRRIESFAAQRSAGVERRRMAHEIHDRVIQNLFAIGLEVEAARSETPESELRNRLSETRVQLNAAITELRAFIGLMAPERIVPEELEPRLKRLASDLDSPDGPALSLDWRVPPASLEPFSEHLITEVFFAAQEAVRNAIEHSSASHIRITGLSTLNSIDIAVIDNGTGIRSVPSPSSAGRSGRSGLGVGISSMRERCSSVGAELLLETSSRGTRVTVSIPLSTGGFHDRHSGATR